MTKTNKIGFVAPHPIPEVIRHVDGFALGVRAVNPTATVHVVWTNSWFDPGKEKEAATSLIDAGADIVATGADSAAPMQAAQEKGRYAIGYDSDGRAFAPGAFLTAPIWDWTLVYRDTVQKVKDGTWTSTDFFGGLSTNVIKLAPLSDLVPADVKAEEATWEGKLKGGEYRLFTGPVKDQAGTVRVPPGQVLSDEDQLKMDWFVEGVVGTVPK